MLEQSVEANPGIPALRALLASSLCWLDRREDAATILTRAASDRFADVRPAADELTALVLYAEAAAQTGDREAAAILYDRIQPWADQVDWNTLFSARTCATVPGPARVGPRRARAGRRAPGVRVRVPRSQRHAAVERPAATSAGPKHSPSVATPTAHASTPHAHSSSRASTATAPSSLARRRWSRPSQLLAPDPGVGGLRQVRWLPLCARKAGAARVDDETPELDEHERPAWRFATRLLSRPDRGAVRHIWRSGAK